MSSLPPSRHEAAHAIDQRNQVIGSLDDRLAQALTVAGQQPQAGIGAVHGALDGRLDQGFRIAPARLAATEDRLEQLQALHLRALHRLVAPSSLRVSPAG
jgi:hypothetical protein